MPAPKSKRPMKRSAAGRKEMQEKAKADQLAKSEKIPTLSPYQIKTNEEFMKLREGETREQWEERTYNRRIRMGEDLAPRSIKNKQIRITKRKKRSRKKSNEKYNKKHFMIEVTDVDNDFMKYYLPLMTYACVKYDMLKEDIELAFYFYSKPVFSGAEFMQKCLLFSKRSKMVLERFYINGYVLRLSGDVRDYSDKTAMFKLSAEMRVRIGQIYKLLKMEKLVNQKKELFAGEKTTRQEKAIEDWLIELNKETTEILLGKKVPERIVYREE